MRVNEHWSFGLGITLPFSRLGHFTQSLSPSGMFKYVHQFTDMRRYVVVKLSVAADLTTPAWHRCPACQGQALAKVCLPVILAR